MGMRDVQHTNTVGERLCDCPLCEAQREKDEADHIYESQLNQTSGMQGPGRLGIGNLHPVDFLWAIVAGVLALFVLGAINKWFQ